MTGERGSVRELCERGDRTDVVVVCFPLPVREAGRVAVVASVLPRVGFFETRSVSAVSFSLSEAICMSELFRFFPRAAAAVWDWNRAGEGDLVLVSCWRGRGGRGFGGESCCLGGDARGLICVVFAASCRATNSPIVIFRTEMGIRWTRLSSRDRSSAA